MIKTIDVVVIALYLAGMAAVGKWHFEHFLRSEMRRVGQTRERTEKIK